MRNRHRSPTLFALFIFAFLFAASAEAGSGSPSKSRAKVASKTFKKMVKRSKPSARASVAASSHRRLPSQAQSLGALDNMDISRSLEVRGQTRNLSMMLVLKNGKDSIDFVKVRTNYMTEITATEF